MDIANFIKFFLLGILIYRLFINDYIKEGHCGTCLEDLKECSKNCSKPNECKIVNDKYECILPIDNEYSICKYIHIPFFCK